MPPSIVNVGGIGDEEINHAIFHELLRALRSLGRKDRIVMHGVNSLPR
jgi:hypothetical protein